MQTATNKIISAEEIARIVGSRPRSKKVAMCHGVFDLVHPGHIAHLQAAKDAADILVVSITNDRHVEQNKGKGHPRIPQKHRALSLAALEMVDMVTIDLHPTPCENLQVIQPDIYFKGADYKENDVSMALLQSLEGETLKKYGGELRFTDCDVTYSSTELLHFKRDFGLYHKDPALYAETMEKEFAEHAPVILPPEFGRCVRDNLLMLTIRLARYKFAAKMLKPTDRCLEIGCGFGLGTGFLAQFCKNIEGIDVQEHAIEEAKRFNRRDNIGFGHADFLKVVPSDFCSPYDVVLAMDVIEHMEKSKGAALIKNASQFIKPNGMCIIGTPSKYSWPYQSKESLASHVHCYDMDELVEMVDKYFGRTITFSMNDEVVHTGHPKMAWYYFVLGFCPK